MMTPKPDRHIANMDGTAALPRQNGELVFEAPWEGRIFGMAVTLNEQGTYAWREFRDQLVAEIAEAEAKEIATTYYDQWLASFEKLLIARGLITQEELEARAAEYASGLKDDDH